MKTINFTILLFLFITITQLVSIEQSNETLNPVIQDPTQKQIQIIKGMDSNLDLSVPDSTNSSEIELKHWSFSFICLGRIGGPGEDIEDAMIEAEFNKRSPTSWFGSGRSHPFSRMGKLSSMISVKRYIKHKYSISVFFSKTYLGTTHGYHDQAGSLSIDYSTSMLAPIVSINLDDAVRIGIGPALYYTKAWETSGSYSEERERYKTTKVGFLIDAGIRAPWRSPFFVELITQYRKVGQVEIGPFTAEYINNTAELPKSEVNYDHWVIGFGLGFRF